MTKWWVCGVAVAILVTSVAVIFGVATASSRPSASTKTKGTVAEEYGTLGVWEGRLALFCGEETPEEVYDVWVAALPAEEQQKLATGIVAADRTAFLKLLQEYTG